MSRQKGEESELRELGAERGQKRGGSTSIRTTHATTAAAEWLARTRGMSINGAYSHAIALLADGTKWHGERLQELLREAMIDPPEWGTKARIER